MHIPFDASGRERRCLAKQTPDEDLADLLEQAQKSSATPLQNFEFDIRSASKNVLGKVDEAYSQTRSRWNPMRWISDQEEGKARDARTGANLVIDELINQAGVQAEQETDKTYARIHELVRNSSDKYFFHSLRLRTLEQSLQEHRDRKDALGKALKTYTHLCAQSGLPLDGKILAEQQKRIESLDQRTVRYETLLHKSTEKVHAQRSSAEFAHLDAMEDTLRRVLLKNDPSLADNIEQLIRATIGGKNDLIEVIRGMYAPDGKMSAEGKEMLRIARELGGRNTWFFIDKAKRNRAADYYSTRLVEKRELNPSDLAKRIAALRTSRIGQRVRMTIGGDASTYMLMDRPSDKQLTLRLISGSGPTTAIINTDGPVPQFVESDSTGAVIRKPLSAPAFRVSDDASMTYLTA